MRPMGTPPLIWVKIHTASIPFFGRNRKGDNGCHSIVHEMFTVAFLTKKAASAIIDTSKVYPILP